MYSACCWSTIAPHARSRYPRRSSSTLFSRDSTSPMRLLSQRPSPRELTFPRTTVLSRRTKLRRWRIAYRELVGTLAWLARGTRPDIEFATSSLARFGHNPGRVHWDVAKRVLRYLKGANQWRLTLGSKSPRSPPSQTLTGEVTVTTDAQPERIPPRLEVRSSPGEYKKLSCVALLSTETEYLARC